MSSIYDHLPLPHAPSHAPAPPRKPCVLIVDDQPVNVKLLERKFEREGIDTLTAENGKRCVEIARERKPELILLDVMMPEMDGIEACRTLQADPETREIPIIFVTARSGKGGKLDGLAAGAVDYILKPVDLDETVARTRTHLRMREYHRENIALHARIAENKRQAMAGRITLGLSHNLNNLLGLVVGHLDLLRIAQGDPTRVTRAIAGMDKGLSRIGGVISQVLLLGENVRPSIHRIQVDRLLREALEEFAAERDHPPAVTVDLDRVADIWIRTNAAAVEVAIGRLLQNALESVARVRERPPQIVLSAEPLGTGEDHAVIIRVTDNGAGIEASIAENIFDPFISVKADVGSGLGLPLAKHAIELLGGHVTLENRPGGGAVASVTLPVKLESPPPFIFP